MRAKNLKAQLAVTEATLVGSQAEVARLSQMLQVERAAADELRSANRKLADQLNERTNQLSVAKQRMTELEKDLKYVSERQTFYMAKSETLEWVIKTQAQEKK